ncbi:MAG: TIGR02234 family membrane protein, partial [Mycobacterium sp.]
LIPCAVLLLAAAVAALAVRGWPLRLLALLVAVVSAGTCYLAVTFWTIRDAAPRAASLVDLPVASLVGSDRHHWGAAIALASAVATLSAAVLLMRAAVKGGPTAQKYTSPAQRRAAAVDGGSSATMSERMMWDALDHGDDPTRDCGSEGR